MLNRLRILTFKGVYIEFAEKENWFQTLIPNFYALAACIKFSFEKTACEKTFNAGNITILITKQWPNLIMKTYVCFDIFEVIWLNCC